MTQSLSGEPEYVASHEKWVQEEEKRRQEQAERDRALDERIDKLVLDIRDLISRIPPENLRQ